MRERVCVGVVVVDDVEGFIGEAVARQLDRDCTVGLAELGEDVAVEVRAGWEAVEEASLPAATAVDGL